MKYPVKCYVCGVPLESDADARAFKLGNKNMASKRLCWECQIVSLFAAAIYLQFFKMFPNNKSVTSFELVQFAKQEDFPIDCLPEDKRAIVRRCLAVPKAREAFLDAERIDRCLEIAGLDYGIK